MLVVAIVATTSTTYAQYAGDAIRFGNTNYGSSARFKGMAGAQIGVGGDMSSLGGNPAGLGLFTRSEFSLTPEFNNATSKADYLDQTTNDSQNKMNLNHVGVVWYSPSLRAKGENTQKGLISTVFGIGYNRNNDFTQRYSYGGTNDATSMRDYFAELANTYKSPQGLLKAGTLEDMAFNGYLINFGSPGSTNNFTADPFTSNNQLKTETTAGSTSELNFSGAFNISNQFYIGASVGIVNIRSITDAVYSETGVINPYNNDINEGPIGYTGNENYKLAFSQSQETKGSGVNGRLGVIFRPIPEFRFGATLQTPTWLYIDDSYAEVLNNTLSGKTPFSTNNRFNTNDFSYRLKTPMKGSLGASYVFAGTAILSADVDFVDYASTRFLAQNGNRIEDIKNNNNDIKTLYTSTMNYRIGGEYKLNQLSLRVGYGINGSPLKNDDDKIYQRKYYTGGIGYRINEYFFDLAYQRSESENRMSSYVLANGGEPQAIVKNANNNVFLTFGLKF